VKKPVVCFAAAGLLAVLLICVQLWRGDHRPPITVTVETCLSEETDKLNINTATEEQLRTLPGVGPELARRILDYRQENGGFQTVSELTMVKGIGISLLDEIMDSVTIGG